MLGRIRGVVDPVAHDLSIGLLRFIPVNNSCGSTHHVTPDLPWCRAGCLFSCFGLNALTGWPPANVVDSHNPKFVVGVRAEAPHTVPGGGYTINLLVQVVRVLGLVLDYVVGDWFRISRVPSQCYAGGGPLRHHRNARSLG